MIATYNTDHYFMCFIGSEIVATVDYNRTGVPSIYHVKCEILIKANPSMKICECCKKYRKTLTAMASRKQKDTDRTDPSSHTAYVHLSTPEKNERLSRLHKDNKRAMLEIKRLKQKISAAITLDGVSLSDELHDDVKMMASAATKQIYSEYPENSFQRLFWEQQVQASKYSNAKSMKWHPLFIKWCLYLRHVSGKSYELLRSSGYIKLPSQSTLRDDTHFIPSGIGFCADVDKNLVDVAFLTSSLNKYIFLIMDEMHIKNDLVYDKHEASLIGFVNLGKTNNQLLEFEEALLSEKTELPLASSMLVLMVRGLFCQLNYPYAQFACNDISGALMFDPVWEAISRLERLGFYVLGVTCDGASPNRRLWKLHSGVSEQDELMYKVPNPFADGDSRYIYFVSDPPHLLKTIRNSLYNQKRQLWVSLHVSMSLKLIFLF